MQTTQEKEHQLEPELLNQIKKFSSITELIHDTAMMRFHQKSFFREKDNARVKAEHLAKSKEYEKKVDLIIESFWSSKKQQNQTKLF